MKTIYHFLLVSFLSAAAVCTQGQTSTNHSTTSTARVSERSGDDAKSKRGPVFRASKDQVIAAQTLLKSKGVYSGEVTGKLDDATRDSIKSYQKNNGLRASGTLNRATLEKMGVALSDKQKTIPVSETSFAKADNGEKPKRGPVFRATKDQIIEAQKLLKASGMYTGEESGKLDDPTRDSLRKYQERKGLKVTGTLNQLTLEKMGITLTDKQKSVDETR